MNRFFNEVILVRSKNQYSQFPQGNNLRAVENNNPGMLYDSNISFSSSLSVLYEQE